MKYFIVFLMFLMSRSVLAQGNFNWPEDPDLKSEAINYDAQYRQYMKAQEWPQAATSLKWLIKNVPDLDPSIYIKGAEIYDEFAKMAKTKAEKDAYIDTVLMMYDGRIANFDPDVPVLNRKAYAAFRYYYKTEDKYDLLIDLYAQVYEESEYNIERYNYVPMMTLATSFYKFDDKMFPVDRVLEIYDRIASSVDYRKKQGKDLEKLKGDMDKVDALLASSVEMSCDFIRDNLAYKLSQGEADIGLAKKVVRYSLSSGCSSEPFFLDAAVLVYKNDPQPAIAKAIGDKYAVSKQYNEAIDYYERALEGTTDTEGQYQLTYSIARTYRMMGRKTNARSKAYEAAKIDPSQKDPYDLIGDLYYSSFPDCKGGQSKVKDRAIFIAAYDMYQKAGNYTQAAAAREQFPSGEEIFTENFDVGQNIQIGCWINTTVKLAKRD